MSSPSGPSGIGRLLQNNFEGVLIRIRKIEIGVIPLIIDEIANPFWRVETVGHEKRGNPMPRRGGVVRGQTGAEGQTIIVRRIDVRKPRDLRDLRLSALPLASLDCLT